VRALPSFVTTSSAAPAFSEVPIDFRCMHAVTAEEVTEKVLEVLNGRES
jgi:hypothetical protein